VPRSGAATAADDTLPHGAGPWSSTVAGCETIGSYFLGQQELRNDQFSGESGVYIYEEVPRRDIKGGIMGGGIEKVLDSLLKFVGI
jgi:hypothetical protein